MRVLPNENVSHSTCCKCCPNGSPFSIINTLVWCESKLFFSKSNLSFTSEWDTRLRIVKQTSIFPHNSVFNFLWFPLKVCCYQLRECSTQDLELHSFQEDYQFISAEMRICSLILLNKKNALFYSWFMSSWKSGRFLLKQLHYQLLFSMNWHTVSRKRKLINAENSLNYGIFD